MFCVWIPTTSNSAESKSVFTIGLHLVPLPLPRLGPRGGGLFSLAGEGVGGPNSDDWKDTLVLYIVVLYGIQYKYRM
jgi:hypothetical protein